MLFTGYDFLFIFLPVALLLYSLCPAPARTGALTVISYAFYAFWDYRFCSLLLASTLSGYYAARSIYSSKDNRPRKTILVVAILFNLGLLGYFKYTNFFIDSLQVLFPALPLRHLQVILPIGISFYTFQTVAYIVDVYRCTSQPAARFIDFACHISMFPKLVAGPIARYRQIEPFLSSRTSSLPQICSGMRRCIIGLAKKVLIAEPLAAIADSAFSITEPTFAQAWVGAFSFSLQIYFDFSGYSDIAIGLGRIFGFELPENFNFSYKAAGISDFWRRWHMSLSSWLRDYVYIPLGGSRRSKYRTYVNLLATFLVCGLWHGASWTFVLWGGYHGVLMMLERPFHARTLPTLPKWLLIAATYCAVVFGWVLFRAESFSQAAHWLSAMVGLGGFSLVLPQGTSYGMIAFVVVMQISCWVVPSTSTDMRTAAWTRDLALIVLLVITLIVIFGSHSTPFLYYQF
jgi:alginate O-acetyltransferase complex protein AlgI